MIRNSKKFGFEFVETIPRQLEEGILYISPEFETATHLCACGCKEKVVTPLSSDGWKLIYTGTTVTLDPSIGNWSLPCRSHYYIKKNTIVWANNWNDGQIEATRKVREYDRAQAQETKKVSQENKPTQVKETKQVSLFKRVINYIFG